MYTLRVSLERIGAAIAAERARQGLAAGELGIDPAIVAATEAGRSGITTTQLAAVASRLQLDVHALREGAVVSLPQPSVFLRHRTTQDFDDTDLPTLDKALDHARARNALARLIGETPGLFPQHQLAPRGPAGDSSSAPAHQGYQLASELRRALGNVAGPLDDARLVAEAAVGIVVVVRRLSTIGSSAFAVKAGDAGAIVLGAFVGLGREPHARVAIAHELCHLLFDPDTGGVNLVIDYEIDRHASLIEQRARAFAAELLLPEDGLRALLGAPKEVGDDASAMTLVARARDAFGSTWMVAANHLCNLRFIRRELRQWLESHHPLPLTRDWSTSLPAEGAPSRHVAWLTQRAHEAGHLTDGEARALLGIDRLRPLPWDA